MPQLRLKRAAQEHYEALPPNVADAVDLVLLKIAANPRDTGTPLQGRLEGKWKRNEGGYRVIYRIVNSDRLVLVESIQKRGSS